MLAIAPTVWPVIIALAVGVAAILWWVFDSAPAGSRRDRFDGRVGHWGEGQMAKGSSRTSYRLWLISVLGVLALLVITALR
jgi:hypothetical protein